MTKARINATCVLVCALCALVARNTGLPALAFAFSLLALWFLVAAAIHINFHAGRTGATDKRK